MVEDLFFTWLIEGGVGPALVGLPVNWVGIEIAEEAKRWFRRVRRTDDLSRLVRAATGTSVDLSRTEFDAVRRMVEDPQTWVVAGRGTVEDLTHGIASCLPSGDGRTAESSHAAAIGIARGLLEHAAASLDPKYFQQLLVARLGRMESGLGSALDEALLHTQADMVAGFASMMDQFKRVLAQLPPGPAHRGEITVYLTTLIEWLSTDPWPQDPRFNGPVLTPADVERKLRVTFPDKAAGPDVDADGLAQECRRLVVLGRPGSGKTWLAKRTARRCAERALAALAAGEDVDDIELPLYTTFSNLFSAPGSIRVAAVSSALDHVGDLGGERISKALAVFFAERNAWTVLVIDALDETHCNDEQLRQVGTLPWRIVLTTRPGSWDRRFLMPQEDDANRVVELQPLRYPDDVAPLIRRWFAPRPQRGDALVAQIAQRPDLQQAATVPLILAFCCIIGGDQPLPTYRHDLYTKVLNRMLTGRWHGKDDPQPANAQLRKLRGWAWSAAACHPVSGVGTWADDFAVEFEPLTEAGDTAFDHIASPVGPPDVDSGETVRRFIHRSLREHLVAEHVASLPVDKAAKVLLPHLWYDPDWEYSTPSAIAMHPQHDQLLRTLICCSARSDHIPADLGAVDVRGQFRRLVARVAGESCEADWSPEVAKMIGQVRVELALAGRMGVITAVGWGTSDRQAREALLELLPGQTDGRSAAELVDRVIRLDPTAEQRRRAREVLLGLLRSEPDGGTAAILVERVIRLDPTARERCQAREVLLGLLRSEPDSRKERRRTAGPADERSSALAVMAKIIAGRAVAENLVNGVVRLCLSTEERCQARDTILGLLASPASGWAAKGLAGGLLTLDATVEEKGQARGVLLNMLARKGDSSNAVYLVRGLIRLGPTAEEIRQARDLLLGLPAFRAGGWTAVDLGRLLLELDPTAEDKQQIRLVVLGILDGLAAVDRATDLGKLLLQLDPTAEENGRTRDILLGLLASGRVYGWRSEDLARQVAQLDPTAEGRHQACEVLLGLLADQTEGDRAIDLAHCILQFDPSLEDKRKAHDVVLGLLGSQSGHLRVADLVGCLLRLGPAADERRRTRDVLLGVLADQTDGTRVTDLVRALIRLDLTAEDKRQVENVLVELADRIGTAGLRWGLVQVIPTEEKRPVRDILLRQLASETDGLWAMELVGLMLELDPVAEDKRQACHAILGLLATQSNGNQAINLVGCLLKLDPMPEDKCRARSALLSLLPHSTDISVTERLVQEATKLDPSVHDLSTWAQWAPLLTSELLAAMRRNSTPDQWLAALPLLS